jgi:hypothetical protein
MRVEGPIGTVGQQRHRSAADGEDGWEGQAEAPGEQRQERRAEHQADDPLEGFHATLLVRMLACRGGGEESGNGTIPDQARV